VRCAAGVDGEHVRETVLGHKALPYSRFNACVTEAAKPVDLIGCAAGLGDAPEIADDD
jgi:hypothetical protein